MAPLRTVANTVAAMLFMVFVAAVLYVTVKRVLRR